MFEWVKSNTVPKVTIPDLIDFNAIHFTKTKRLRNLVAHGKRNFFFKGNWIVAKTICRYSVYELSQ